MELHCTDSYLHNSRSMGEVNSMATWTQSFAGNVVDGQHDGIKMVIAKGWNSEQWGSAVHKVKNKNNRASISTHKKYLQQWFLIWPCIFTKFCQGLKFNGSMQSSSDAIWEQERDAELYSASRENEGYKNVWFKTRIRKVVIFNGN